jgi:hypothetical protein
VAVPHKSETRRRNEEATKRFKEREALREIERERLAKEWKRGAEKRREERRIAEEKNEAEKKRNPCYRAGGVPNKPSLGMTSEVAEACLGRPDDVNRTTSARGVREQWVYPERRWLENGQWVSRNRMYLYFDDGRLISFQEQ